jgi:hypothetical protein
VIDPDARAALDPILPAATETTHRPRKHSQAKQTSIKQWSPYQYGDAGYERRREVYDVAAAL